MTGSAKVNPAAKLENIMERDKHNMGLVLLKPEDDLQTAALSDIHIEAGDAEAPNDVCIDSIRSPKADPVS